MTQWRESEKGHELEIKVKGKGKAIPLQVLRVPAG